MIFFFFLAIEIVTLTDIIAGHEHFVLWPKSSEYLSWVKWLASMVCLLLQLPYLPNKEWWEQPGWELHRFPLFVLEARLFCMDKCFPICRVHLVNVQLHATYSGLFCLVLFRIFFRFYNCFEVRGPLHSTIPKVYLCLWHD